MATIPSIALIPSGYKAGKVYSVLPTDGTGDFDFTRSGSATRVNSQGLIELVDSNVPRLNYPLIDGVVQGCPSLLLEPERRNLVTYSEDFSGWNGGYYTTPNYAISPDGTLNASRLLFTGASQVLLKTTSLASGVSCSATFYVKGNAGETIQLAAGGIDTMHTLNGSWQRLETNQTSANSTILLNTFGGSTARDLLIWGAQLEQGSYATSYIPTNGSTATRSAETCNGAGNDQVINSTEGVLYIETSALANDLSERRFVISDGSSSNVVRVGYTNVSNRIIAVVYNGSNQAVLTYTSSDITQKHKIAVKYKENDFALWVNGVERSTDVSGSVFSANTLNSLDFNSGGNHFYSDTKEVKIYNTALTDAELQALTQI